VPTAAHAITTELDDDEINRRLALPDADIYEQVARETGLHPQPLGVAVEGQRFFRPFEDAADEYVAWSREPGRRIYTGIDEFDSVMRGVAPKELCLIVGYAHSGKTVFTTQVLLHNKHRRLALFTPDETRVLVLVKLASIIYGVSAEEIEQRLYHGDPEMEEALRDVARRHFPNLAVFDELSELGAMDKALDEVEAWWDEPAEGIIIDYADLITGAGEDVPSKMNAIKAWGKRRNCAVFLLHQTSRSTGAAGRKMRIDSGGYGGEQQALFMIGVRRKKAQYLALIEALQEKLDGASNPTSIDRYEQQIAEAEYDLRRHQNTITFSLVKNKRPPSRLVDDTDFILDPETGRVQKLDHEPTIHTTYEPEGMF
jgi:archaellum biogenesis ATPase FlaH